MKLAKAMGLGQFTPMHRASSDPRRTSFRTPPALRMKPTTKVGKRLSPLPRATPYGEHFLDPGEFTTDPREFFKSTSVDILERSIELLNDAKEARRRGDNSDARSLALKSIGMTKIVDQTVDDPRFRDVASSVRREAMSEIEASFGPDIVTQSIQRSFAGLSRKRKKRK